MTCHINANGEEGRRWPAIDDGCTNGITGARDLDRENSRSLWQTQRPTRITVWLLVEIRQGGGSDAKMLADYPLLDDDRPGCRLGVP